MAIRKSAAAFGVKNVSKDQGLVAQVNDASVAVSHSFHPDGRVHNHSDSIKVEILKSGQAIVNLLHKRSRLVSLGLCPRAE